MKNASVKGSHTSPLDPIENKLNILTQFIHANFLSSEVPEVHAVVLKDKVINAHPELESKYEELLRLYLRRNIDLIAKGTQKCKLSIFLEFFRPFLGRRGRLFG